MLLSAAMGSKDFTSWYELEADSDSDDNSTQLAYSHEVSRHRSVAGTRLDHRIHISSSGLASRQSGQGSLIQQLLDEMDDANQKIDQYTGSRKSDGMSLEEYSIDSMSTRQKEDICDAIAEVSKDFTSGNLSSGPLVLEESDDSRVSSDNESRYSKGAAYAKYPETAAGLSDNDWNPYITESDTNMSPRLGADLRPASYSSSNSDSKFNSLASSFNPPLCSTKAGSASRTAQMISQRTGQDSSQLSDIREKPELSFGSVKSPHPNISLSPPQLTSSKLSEYSFESREDAARNLKRCFERTSWPPSPEKSVAPERPGQPSQAAVGGSLGRPYIGDSIDIVSIENSFKKLRNFGEGAEDESSWEIKSSLPGCGYFSDAVQSALSGPVAGRNADLYLHKSGAGDGVNVREKLSRELTASKDSEKSGHTRLSRDSDKHTGSSSGSSIDTVIPASSRNKASASSESTQQNRLTYQVNKLLRETAYLTGSSRAKDVSVETKDGKASTSLDYDRLHKDLQEIQDSLHTMGQPVVSPVVTSASNAASTSKSESDEGDVVPSTTTTPEKGRRLLWDYSADLGCRDGAIYNLEGMMSDIISESSPMESRLSKQDKINYTSDGEETRTSSVDHAEEEEHPGEANLMLEHAMASAGGGTDLDHLLTTFRVQTRALENRYQAVRSQGMADKVMSILTSTNPDQQAEGILSQVTAEEQKVSLCMAGLDTGHSGSSPLSSLSGSKTEDPVRKRLDMSSLDESDDSARILNSYLESNPKLEAMFSATGVAQSLISAQMKKMAERTFNHSLEFKSPQRQEVQCYPVYSFQRDQPQHQQLQQQLQQQLHKQQQQQQQQQEQKSQGDLTTPKSVMAEDKAKPSGADGSPSSGASPTDSDRSSEMHRGKYRPYRPAGSQDVYYTESDTASVAESVTTVESTHTGSDDAVSPYFPSSVLGSRSSGAGGEQGMYAKHRSTTDPHLPTIEERSTVDSASDSAASRGSDSGPRSLGSRIPMPVGGLGGISQHLHSLAPGEDSGVSSITARQLARVENIVRQKDSARKIRTSEESHKKLAEEPGGKEKEEEERKAALLGSSSLDSGQRSKIPVRGPPPNYQAALDSKLDSRLHDPPHMGLTTQAGRALQGTGANRQPSFAEASARINEDRSGTSRDAGAGTSEEARLLKAIDAQVEAEIRETDHKSASAENSDEGSVKTPCQRQQDAGSHEALTLEVKHTERGHSKLVSSSQSEERDTWAKRTEQHRMWQEAGSAVPEDLHIEEAETEELVPRQDQRAKTAMNTAIRKDAEANRAVREAEVTSEAASNLSNNHTTQQSSQAVAGQIQQGQEEINDAVLDKRREEAELERRHLEAQIARERELNRAKQAVHEKELQEAQARRHQVLAAAEARREKGLQQERELRRQREDTAAQLQRKARDAELRQQEQLRADLQQERERQRKGEMQREEEQRQTRLSQREEEESQTRLRQREEEERQTRLRLREEEERQTRLRQREEEERQTRLRQREEEERQTRLRLREEEERQTRLRPREEEERQTRLRQREEEERQTRLRQREEEERQTRLRQREEEERQTRLRQREEEERQTRLRQREEEERQTRLRQREEELRQLRLMMKESDSHRAAELKRELKEREVAQASQALTSELTTDMAHLQHHNALWESESQREAEEAIRRAGGGTRAEPVSLHVAGREADTEVPQMQKVQQGGRRPSDDSIDQQPLSHRVQILREALEQETAYMRPDLHVLWERFMAGSDPPGQDNDSSLGSEKMDLLVDLCRDPTQHLVHTFLSERQKQQLEDRQRAVACRQSDSARLKEEELAVLDRELRRQQARQQQQRLSSEEESNGSYGEILQQRERDRLKRREVRTQRKKFGKSPSPSSFLSKPKNTSAGSHLELDQGDTQVTLYSIPEDLSYNAAPQQSLYRVHVNQRQEDVIDPHMDKLRSRILQQRKKISKERVKEAQREHKLDRLNALLQAKRTGLLDDRAVSAHLASISITSASSDDTPTMHSPTSPWSEHTTTAKDSSTEMQRAKLVNRSHACLCNEDGRNVDLDQFLESELTLLQEDSSLTETDDSFPSEHGFRRKKFSLLRYTNPKSSKPSKHGGRHVKRHKVYSPYQRQEVYQPKPMKIENKKHASHYHKQSPVHKDVSTMYPSPKSRHPSRMISRSIQTHTSPESHRRSPQGQLSRGIEIMSLPVGRGDAAKQSGMREISCRYRSTSPIYDSRQVAACLSPDRGREERSASASPARTDRYRQGSSRHSPKRHSPKRHSPSRHYSVSPPKLGHYQETFIKERSPVPSSMSWFIPLKDENKRKGGQSSRKDAQGRQGITAGQEGRFVQEEWKEEWRPTTLSPQQWRELARKDLEHPKEETARMYLHPSTKEAEQELVEQYDKFEQKPLCRMSLQEALMSQRPGFVSNVRQRQKRVKLAAENRQLQALVRAEQEMIFACQGQKTVNPNAHPYSENLYNPRRRMISKGEMKEMTKKVYKSLPEVKTKEVERLRQEEYRLNRLRAQLFNKRVQRTVLDKKIRNVS